MPAPTLNIPRLRLAEMREHARCSYPEECCGVLLGRRPAPVGPVQVVEVVPTPNDETGTGRRHGYRIAPSEVLAAQRRGRERGLEVVGFYHSHPDRPAIPSPRDRREAWPRASYLIVAVGAEGTGTARSWRWIGDGSGPVEEGLVVGTEGTSRPSPRRPAGARP